MSYNKIMATKTKGDMSSHNAKKWKKVDCRKAPMFNKAKKTE